MNRPHLPNGDTSRSTPPLVARIQRAVNEVRAECGMCGSHAYVTPGVPRSNKCGNCGSFELHRLAS